MNCAGIKECECEKDCFTKRELIAKDVMVAMIRRQSYSPKVASEEAVQYADALLSALSKES